MLAFTSPEWVYIYRDPTPRLVEGVARSTHTAGGDLPEGHDWYDLNSNIDVDPQYAYLLSTANLITGGEEFNRLHVEWETGTVPTYTWPTEGDRVKLWGSWIWDCGHWGQGYMDPDYFLPGTGETPFSTEVRGEQSELHPMQAMVVTRANPYRPTVKETEADVFMSSAGTLARAEEECAYEYPAATQESYGPDYTACVNDPSKQRQPVNDRDYTFFVPAPPKPLPSAKLSYRVIDMVGGIGPQERVQVLSNGISVTVPFHGFGDNALPLSYGKSFFVRWLSPSKNPPPPAHLRVHLDKLTVNNSLDPSLDRPGTDYPSGEYNLYIDANGYWKLLNDWAPGLGAVSDGDSFQLNKDIDIYVPAGGGVRVFVHGRECDLPKINPCPLTTELAPDNDLPGDVIDQFASADAAVGSHTLRPDSGNYELTYSIARVTP
jgi:hypothetical protein